FRIPGNDDRAVWNRCSSRSDDDASRFALHDVAMELRFGVTQIGRARILQTGHGVEHDIQRTNTLSVYQFRDLLRGSIHDALLRKSATAWAVASPCSIQAGTETPSMKLP